VLSGTIGGAPFTGIGTADAWTFTTKSAPGTLAFGCWMRLPCK
jgi:hypothetical protein